MAASSSSVKGFYVRKALYGVNSNPTVLDFIIAASATITLGDAVRLNTAGGVVRCAAGEPVLGIVVGLVDRNGINVFEPRADQTGLTGVTLTPDDTIAVSSTNLTDATRNIKAQVVLDPAGSTLYSNVTDGTLAQTNVGQFYDVATNAGQISTASASDTSGQFQLLSLDPDGDGVATKGLFRVAECQLTTNINSYNSTAVIAA